MLRLRQLAFSGNQLIDRSISCMHQCSMNAIFGAFTRPSICDLFQWSFMGYTDQHQHMHGSMLFALHVGTPNSQSMFFPNYKLLWLFLVFQRKKNTILLIYYYYHYWKKNGSLPWKKNELFCKLQISGALLDYTICIDWVRYAIEWHIY